MEGENANTGDLVTTANQAPASTDPDDEILALLKNSVNPQDDSDDPNDPDISADEPVDIFGEPHFKYKATIKGREEVLTAEDLVNHYQKGIRADEKFSEAAEIRKRSEEAIREIETQRQQYLANHNQMEQAIQQVLLQAQVFEQAEPDEAQMRQLLETDPHEYMKIKEGQTHRSQVKNQLLQTLQYMQQQKEVELATAENARLQREGQVLLTEYFPEWRDPAVRKKAEDEYLGYLRENGYGEQEIQSLNRSQAKNISLVVKAMKYDRLMAKAKEVSKAKSTRKTEATPTPTVKGNAAPATTNPSQMTDAQFAAWRKKTMQNRA